MPAPFWRWFATPPTPAGQARAAAAAIAAAFLDHLGGAKAEAGHRWDYPAATLAPHMPAVVAEMVDGRGTPAVPDGTLRIALVAATVDPARLSQRAFDDIVAADAWFCQSRSAYESVVARAAASGADGLLSGCCGWRAEPEPLAALVTRRLSALLERRLRCRIAAMRDARYRAAWTRLGIPVAGPLLTLVISAYNGADFIARSISHCLELMKPFGDRVSLIVADNASTDDTAARVASFVDRGEVEYLRAAANTGCSATCTSSRRWCGRATSGPSASTISSCRARSGASSPSWRRSRRALSSCRTSPSTTASGSPPQETCAALVADSQPVGRRCRADAMTDVRHAAAQHDNLLTAFYIIVFRSDLMAAVFNSPFTAPFFGSLHDTIPTTKVIFEAFADYAAAWLAKPAVVGNAHNSWRHHRVAWHGILMPQALSWPERRDLTATGCENGRASTSACSRRRRRSIPTPASPRASRRRRWSRATGCSASACWRRRGAERRDATFL